MALQKRRAKELQTNARDSVCRSSIVDDNGGGVQTLEVQAHTPKRKRSKKRPSTEVKKLAIHDCKSSSRPVSVGRHEPIALRTSVGGTPDNRGTPTSKKRKLVENATIGLKNTPKLRTDIERRPTEELPKKRKTQARRKSVAVDSKVTEAVLGSGNGKTAYVGAEKLSDDVPVYDEEQVEPKSREDDETSARPPLGIPNNKPTQTRRILHRPRTNQPWSVNKHIIMSRDILREARSVDVSPKIWRRIRQTLDMQKNTKTVFQEIVDQTSYVLTPTTLWDAEKRHAICNQVINLAKRSNIRPQVQGAILNNLNAFIELQKAIQITDDTVQSNILELLSETSKIIGHVKLAHQTLRKSIQQGQKIKVKRIHDHHWELHSKDYVKTRERAKNTGKWHMPQLIFRRNDCHLENGQREHRCHVAGILIGGEELETHCFITPKNASLDPIVASAQEGRYVAEEEDSCKIPIVFLGHGCLKLRLPQKYIEGPLLRNVSENDKTTVDFYGVQVTGVEE